MRAKLSTARPMREHPPARMSARDRALTAAINPIHAQLPISCARRRIVMAGRTCVKTSSAPGPAVGANKRTGLRKIRRTQIQAAKTRIKGAPGKLQASVRPHLLGHAARSLTGRGARTGEDELNSFSSPRFRQSSNSASKTSHCIINSFLPN